MPPHRRRRRSRAILPDPTRLSGTTAVSHGSSSGSHPVRQSPSPSRSSGRRIDDGLPASSVTTSSRSVTHSPSRNRPQRRVVSGGGHASSHHSRNRHAAPSGRAPSHRPFAPATVAPSEYLGERGPNSTNNTVGPWDSISQAPTRVSRRRYESGHRPEYERSQSPSVVHFRSEDFECAPISFPHVRSPEDADAVVDDMRFRVDHHLDAMHDAQRELRDTRGSGEFPATQVHNLVKAHHKYSRAVIDAELFFLYHSSIVYQDIRDW
ncbi:hypothetical protein FSPOR_9125 [Fusarium sporotrichioides]|uniref:Uncharacterized protein n=1 Tax=Fusarium sporotrichioides TaxID=5514 RepID=A0A395RQZ4_FUSSP|nr:hypothetical protein FSPOR_9125 [Fusarium sporotrichioides]